MTTRLSRYALIVILALGLLLATLQLNGHLVPAGDNATYIVLGQSLATGQGYRMISDPRRPSMALYPPAYPLALAGVLLLSRTAHNLLAAIVPMKLLSIALYLLGVALIYEIFRRRNPVLAMMAALLSAVNPHLLYYANEVGTEIPYLVLSLACIWLFERYCLAQQTARLRQERDSKLLVATVLALALTSYVRSIALVMVVAFGLYLLLRRQVRTALLLVLAVGVLAAPWLVYSSSLPSTGTSVGLGRGYFALYFSSDPYGTTRASLADWVARIVQNSRIYALGIWPEVLFAHAFSISRVLGGVGIAFLAMAFAMVLLGFALEAKRGHASEWYVALFFASCISYLWAQSRLIVPIIPFAIYYFLSAFDFLVAPRLRASPERWRDFASRKIRTSSPNRWRDSAVWLIAVCILSLSALVADVRDIQRNLRYGLGQPVETYYGTDAEWSNYLKAMRWIETNAPQGTAVMCRKADLLYVLTRHRALEYPYSADGKELRQALYNSRVAYLIEDAFTWTGTTQQYLRPALQDWQNQDPSALALAYETTKPATRVWRVRQP